MRSGFRRRHRAVLVVVAVLCCAGSCAAVFAADRVHDAEPAARPARNILSIHVVPRATPALLAVEQAFTSTLKSITSDRLAFHSEYVDLGMLDRTEAFEKQLVDYLAAKYAMDWIGTLAAARRLQPDIERVVVVTGASPIDRSWATEARAQLGRIDISITFLTGMPIDTVLERVSALPPHTVVILGAFLSDSSGRRFFGTETTHLISSASTAPVFALADTQLGYGAVGGHVVSFEPQGRRAAEIAARMLRGERPPPIEGETLAYRFDARQLHRFGLDRRRLPSAATIEFDRPSLWQSYGYYAMAAALLLGLQTWMIVRLLINRSHRRRAEKELAGRLRFETLMSDLIAGQLTTPAAGVDAEIERGLTLIAEDLDVDRIIIGERDESRQNVRVTHSWTRPETPQMSASITTSAFPWITRRVAEGHIVVVSPRHPLPSEAAQDRQGMLAYGTRSLLVVPLLVKRTVVGILTCATVRHEREWPDTLIERLKLLADVFASTLARHRAEAAARASEERFEQQRQELAHALRVNTLGELGASLAHELNQPLAAILANVRALSVLHGDDVADETSEAVADIAASAKRAGDIIRRLRALSRKEYVREHGLQLDALVDEVIGLLQQDFLRRGIVVARVSAPHVPTVTGDRIQLQQIILNLLVNASEALDSAEPGRRDITVTTSQPARGLVEIAIRDTGVGGKGVDTERMFDRFVSTKPGGLGMGLAISRSIAEAHGGRIYAKPNTDRGLTVYVELPAEA